MQNNREQRREITRVSGVSATKILIIDDDPQMRRMLAKVLTRYGYGVSTAGDGREALDILDHKAVDIILTDIFMPEKDGIEVVLKVRHTKPAIPVVAMSGVRALEADFLRYARMLGAVDILTKPFDPEMLVAMVQRHVPVTR